MKPSELRIILDNACWHMSNDNWKQWAEKALELIEPEPEPTPEPAASTYGQLFDPAYS